ncbi:hypothetical protein CBR_g37823 [Chara braunii]|uniref:Uncharacterized protein n=1 Tax=Chara braunii TaxID=69332 RepID=A0A388LNV8_CHABU|nr:hypothetical protein CBR_g37823 [Chara braunii]|eukprot:GBG83951.1 hypothetical protein CBR_g37823 [Chara braunii]
MGVLTEEEKQLEHHVKPPSSGHEMNDGPPQITWADKLRAPHQGRALTIQRGQGSPRTGKLEIPLEGLPSARAFFMAKFLLLSETRVVSQGGKQVMVKAYPQNGIACRDEVYTKHASNWVFHAAAAFKSVNDKVKWIGRRLEVLKNCAEMARDQFLVQPVSNTTVTVLCMHESDKKVIDGLQRLRCERSEVRIHPWMPLRRMGPEERRAQLMQDFFWVEFRHIPVEVQAAFVYDFGLLYDIVAFIDPLPSFVAKRDDYLMLALDYPQGQPFSLDDLIPYRIGGKEYMIHTAHKLRPWCHKCRAYGHLSTEYTCPLYMQRRARATGRLLRDPIKVTHWRAVDPGHEGWVYIEDRTKEGSSIGWVWERSGEPDWGTRPSNAWTPPPLVEEKVQNKQAPQEGHVSSEWKMAGKKGGKEIWVQKLQTEPAAVKEIRVQKLQTEPAATPGPAAASYIQDEKGAAAIAEQEGTRAAATMELKGTQITQNTSKCAGEASAQSPQSDATSNIPRLKCCGETEILEGTATAARLETGDTDPPQAAFGLDPMDVDPLPDNASRSPEGLDPERGQEWVEEGAPPLDLPMEQKLVAIADWLLANLKAKHGPLTDDFWDKTYLNLFPVLDTSVSLKNVLEKGLQPGVKWSDAWHRLDTIVSARFHAPQAAAKEEASQQGTQEPVPQNPPDLVLQHPPPAPEPEPPDPEEDMLLDLVRKRKLRQLVEMGGDTSPMSQEAALSIPVRKRNEKWEVGLSPTANARQGDITLQGWSSFWASPQNYTTEAAAGILRMQLESRIAEALPPGAQAMASIVTGPTKIAQRDVYICFDPAKENSLRWHTYSQMLNLQLVRIKQSDISSERDVQKSLCALLRMPAGCRLGMGTVIMDRVVNSLVIGETRKTSKWILLQQYMGKTASGTNARGQQTWTCGH